MPNQDYTAKVLDLEDIIVTNVENSSEELRVYIEAQLESEVPVCKSKFQPGKNYARVSSGNREKSEVSLAKERQSRNSYCEVEITIRKGLVKPRRRWYNQSRSNLYGAKKAQTNRRSKLRQIFCNSRFHP